jgi:hypothetical protein
MTGRVRLIRVKQAATGNQMAAIQTLFDQTVNKLRMNLVFEITQVQNMSFLRRFSTAC